MSSDITIAKMASDSDAYPISVDVGFHAIEGGTQVSVNASYMKPVTFHWSPEVGAVVGSLGDVLI